jgi:type VI secretion system protein ImpG
MDRRLLRYYERELRHLRETAVEFAREFPKVAGRLGLDPTKAEECPDPYVERLLEGVAYLTARVQLKLDAEYPRFTQNLLETVYPHYLAPTPSMAIVQFNPDQTEGSLAEGFTIPRGRAMRSTIGRGDQTPCEYRTAHDVTLYPVQVAEAGYYTRDLATIQPPTVDAGGGAPPKAGFRIRLRCFAGATFNQIKADRLAFYIAGADATPMRIYEQIFAQAVAVCVQPVRTPVPWRHVLPARASIGRLGFADEEAMLPFGARSFHGYRLLHEYFTLPQRYMFFEVGGLAPGLARCEESEIDLIILMRSARIELENKVDASNFQLFCTPAVNLFPRRADRIHVTERAHEFQVIADRTRPLDYEVYQVLTVTGYGETADMVREFRPFYAARDSDAGSGTAAASAYFAVQRLPRTLSEREKQLGTRSSYTGSEVYISIVDAAAAPFAPDVRQLGVETLCTNRDLPLRMPVGRGRTDFTMEQGAPVESVRCIAGPTPPKPSLAEGDFAWRIISHLALNYLSIADTETPSGGPPGSVAMQQEGGAAALRELLKLYGDTADPATRKQVDGVKHVRARPITRRVATPGPIAFARGLEVTVGFDEAAFEGSGVFLLGAVLEEFFAKYVSINSFTETVITSPERGEIMRWPARVGLRHIL